MSIKKPYILNIEDVPSDYELSFWIFKLLGDNKYVAPYCGSRSFGIAKNDITIPSALMEIGIIGDQKFVNEDTWTNYEKDRERLNHYYRFETLDEVFESIFFLEHFL